MKDAPDWLGEKIASGEVDYLVKQAHSDGDEKNVFEFSREMELIEGEKKLPDGRSEKIYLAFPTGTPVQVANADFADWVRKRDDAGKGQLLFLNGSCGSAKKAVEEITAARTSVLLNIAAVSSVRLFADGKNNAVRGLLDDIRTGKNFEQMKADVEAISPADADKYVYPNTPGYKFITDHLGDPVESVIKIYDENGRVYDPWAS